MIGEITAEAQMFSGTHLASNSVLIVWNWRDGYRLEKRKPQSVFESFH